MGGSRVSERCQRQSTVGRLNDNLVGGTLRTIQQKVDCALGTYKGVLLLYFGHASLDWPVKNKSLFGLLDFILQDF